MFPEVVHPVVSPLSTAFYNLFALVGIFPKLIDVEERATRSQHHLRYNLETTINGNDSSSGSGGTNTGAPVKPVDPVSERRRAKAMLLLDAKMAELSKEAIGWDEGGAAPVTETSKSGSGSVDSV